MKSNNPMKTKTQIDREIKRRNVQFKRATKAEKRVLIAKDVIGRMKAGQFSEYGGYVSIDYGPLDSKSIQQVILSGTTCRVCAKGGLLLSCTVFKNEQTESSLERDLEQIGQERLLYHFSNGLHDIFTARQFDLIERYFEAHSGCIKYFEKYPDRNARLLAIMKNIVKNKGTFKP